jgi:hypothetical protein
MATTLKLSCYLNQLYDISKAQSIPVCEVPTYIEKKLDEKRRIDEEIKKADILLQSKNVTIEESMNI